MTRKAVVRAAACVAVLALAALATSCAFPPQESKPYGWLVFQDEFWWWALDQRKWQTEYWWGRTNPPELEYYATDAFTVANDRLRIEARRRDMGGMQYTSGAIATWDRFSFTYGYVEIRARVPSGQGLWPAFWLLAEDRSSYSEIDVMEIIGSEPTSVDMTLHYNTSPGPSASIGGRYTGPDFSRDYHTFGVRWSPDAIAWYVDGEERFRVTNHVPQEPMYLIANLAVGGTWPGSPDGTTPLPAAFDIDYIRVWQ